MTFMQTARTTPTADLCDQLLSLPCPLPSLALDTCEPDDLLSRSNGMLQFCHFLPDDHFDHGLILIGTLPFAELRLVCLKTTPLRFKHIEPDHVYAGLCSAGSWFYQQQDSEVSVAPGDLLFGSNTAGSLTTTLSSSIVFQFEPKRLQRTMAAMLGHGDGCPDLGQVHPLRTSSSSISGTPEIGRAHV